MTFRSACLIFLMMTGLQLKAQDYFQQVTIGGSAGATKAFSGASTHKNSIAFSGNFGYYPTPYANFTFEVQGGKLVGSPAAATFYKNKKTFVNNYLSAVFGANVSLGSFYDDPEDGAHKFISPFYFGGGIGVVNNRVTRLDEFTLQTVVVPNHLNLVIPIKFGYEFTVATKEQIPVLKVDLAYSISSTGRGIDGYYDTSVLDIYFYTYASIGLKYAISVGPPRHRLTMGE